LSGDPLPKVDQQPKLVDHRCRFYRVAEPTRATIIPLHMVGDDVAREGFADAAAWRQGHVVFWGDVDHLIREESGNPDWVLRDTRPVVVEWFRLIANRTAADR